MVLYDDYERKAFFMLPTGKKKTKAQRYRLFYTVWLILASLLPVLVTRAFIYYASSGSSCFLC
jgi:heme O synthase-like polyprenyltransferase